MEHINQANRGEQALPAVVVEEPSTREQYVPRHAALDIGDVALSTVAASPEDQVDADERHQEPLPRIWIGSLSDYVNGRLCGDWIDANQEPEDLLVAARQVMEHSASADAEEWAIFDYEGFGPLRLSEHES